MRTFFGVPSRGPFFALTVGLLATASIPVRGQEAQKIQDDRPVQNIQSAEVATQAQTIPPIKVAGVQITGSPEDWTHHYVKFSDPGTEEEAIRQGRHAEWLRTVNDPRYILHAIKRHIPVQGPVAADVAEREALQARAGADLRAATDSATHAAGEQSQDPRASSDPFRPPVWRRPPVRRPKDAPESKKDWNIPLPTGNGLSVLGLLNIGGALTTAQLQPNTYPAKYTFNPSGTPSCPNDYIVYPTGVAGVTNNITDNPILGEEGGPGTPNIIAYNNLDSGILSGITSCGTILEGVFDLGVAPNPTVMWAYNTGGTVTGSPVLSLNGSQIAFIQKNSSGVAQLVLLKWSSPGNSVSVQISVGGLLTVGTSEMINGAEYSYGVGSLPLVGGLLTDYPVATAPTSETTSTAYQSCTAGEATTAQASADTQPAPCMYVLTLSGNATVTNSMPFVDYLNGALYVGDDSGKLHKFTGLAFGEPGTATGEASSTATIQEVTPISVSSYPLSAPVYDNVSGCIFVGDSAGYLHQVDAGNTGATNCKSGTFQVNATSAKLANGTANGILDAPIVDSSNEAVYAFVSSSAALSSPSIASGSNAIDEFRPGFSAGATPLTGVAVGIGGTKMDLLDGDFDNVYYTSSNGTGNMYVVGNTEYAGNGSLYQIPLTANSLGTPKNLGILDASSGANPYASPVMEFCNNAGAACTATNTATTSGVDIVYFSVYKGRDNILGTIGQVLANTNCSLTLAPGGCVFGINVGIPTAPYVYADYGIPGAGFSANPCWATSGMVVDNASSSILNLDLIGAGSQLYYIGSNGNSDSLSSTYNPCSATTTGNVVGASQLGQGNLVL